MVEVENMIFSTLRQATALATLLLVGVAIGCETLNEVKDPETASHTSGWADEFRARDTESRPLGLSDRARDIERSVGIR